MPRRESEVCTAHITRLHVQPIGHDAVLTLPVHCPRAALALPVHRGCLMTMPCQTSTFHRQTYVGTRLTCIGL